MLIPTLVAFGLTLAISPAALVGLRRAGVIDHPTDRSSHDQPTPRAGGIAVGLGAATALLTASSLEGRAWTGVLVVASAFGLVGLIDDLASLPAIWRLVAQVAIAAGAVSWLLPSSGQEPIVQVALPILAILWIVGYVNAYNFMDGINGISVVQAVVAGGAWIVIGEARDLLSLATSAAIIAAALVAFAPFNFPSARMFLGDAGSYFIGAWLAATAVVGLRSGVPPEAVLAPLALYVADTGTTLVRRVRRGETWHAAHRDHSYQRLIDHGWTHEMTTLAVGLALVAVSALGMLSLTDSVALRVAGDVVAGIVLVGYVQAPNWLASRAPAMARGHL